ncbi:MAG: class I SAM-dependent methyltransferase [Gammaproteobacteria bacterium]|nr:class I SAM-dependent methyltransferase [Gammaproteobacteria bacterium]
MLVEAQQYWRCDACMATFLDPGQRPGLDAERSHYQLHRNHPDDARYRAFLDRLANPLLQRLAPASTGLDYGCGPGPALAAMLTEAGHAVRVYDPAYFEDPAALEDDYDFVTCSEVIEHFHRPALEFRRLDTMLRPGGVLAVMTCFQTEDARFAGWHYRRDPTHVVFYRECTLRSIATARGWSCDVPARNVALMTKPSAALAAADTPGGIP